MCNISVFWYEELCQILKMQIISVYQNGWLLQNMWLEL